MHPNKFAAALKCIKSHRRETHMEVMEWMLDKEMRFSMYGEYMFKYRIG